MRAWADPGIIVIPPIGKVVAALFAGSRMVACLIGEQSLSLGQFLSQGKQISGFVIIERLEYAASHIGFKPRPRLNGELVQRKVRSPEIERAR